MDHDHQSIEREARLRFLSPSFLTKENVEHYRKILQENHFQFQQIISFFTFYPKSKDYHGVRIRFQLPQNGTETNRALLDLSSVTDISTWLTNHRSRFDIQYENKVEKSKENYKLFRIHESYEGLESGIMLHRDLPFEIKQTKRYIYEKDKEEVHISIVRSNDRPFTHFGRYIHDDSTVENYNIEIEFQDKDIAVKEIQDRLDQHMVWFMRTYFNLPPSVTSLKLLSYEEMIGIFDPTLSKNISMINPYQLTKDRWWYLFDKDVYLTLKNDGIRFICVKRRDILYFCALNSVVYTDFSSKPKKGFAFSVASSDVVFERRFDFDEGDIVDGELVKEAEGNYRFYIFDIYWKRSIDIRYMIFSERIQCLNIQDDIVPQETQVRENTLYICPKKIVTNYHQNQSLYTHFMKFSHDSPTPEQSKELFRLYEREIQKESNDGIIINTDDPKRQLTKNGKITAVLSIMKWKPIEKLTIDFKLKKEGDQYRLLSSPDDKDNPIFLEERNLLDNSIVECSFRHGRYYRERYRYDKQFPNALEVRDDILRCIENSVSLKDLQDIIQYRGKNTNIFKRELPTGSDYYKPIREDREDFPSFPIQQLHNELKRYIINTIVGYKSTMKKVDILDLGAGRGGDIQKWYSHHKSISHYVAVDNDQSAIDELLERSKELKMSIRAYKRDLQSSPWNLDGTYDIITSFFSLHYYYNENFLKRIKEKLQTDGLFVAVCFIKNSVESMFYRVNGSENGPMVVSVEVKNQKKNLDHYIFSIGVVHTESIVDYDALSNECVNQHLYITNKPFFRELPSSKSLDPWIQKYSKMNRVLFISPSKTMIDEIQNNFPDN